MALNAQLAANNTTLPQFKVDNPRWNGDGSLTAGNMQAAQAGANLTGTAMEGEMDLYAAILPGSIVGKEAEEALQASEAAKGATKCETTAADAIRFHHPFPKYLGGDVQQILEALPKSLHDAFHAGLDEYLPRRAGTDFYDNLSPAARSQMLQKLGAYVKQFDAANGTQLYDAMVREGFPGGQ
jgi:hypothetical protein